MHFYQGRGEEKGPAEALEHHRLSLQSGLLLRVTECTQVFEGRFS